MTMELTRIAVARVVGPFLSKKITDIRRWWPLPFDPPTEINLEDISDEERQREIDELGRLADKYL